MGYFNPLTPPNSFSLSFSFLKKKAEKEIGFSSCFLLSEIKKQKKIPQTITFFVGILSFFVFIQILIYKSSKDMLVDS